MTFHIQSDFGEERALIRPDSSLDLSHPMPCSVSGAWIGGKHHAGNIPPLSSVGRTANRVSYHIRTCQYEINVSATFMSLVLSHVQATSLRGVDVTATVEENVKGTLPPFDQGTVGINVMPLGSVEVGR